VTERRFAHLHWPFFEERHRDFVQFFDGWALRTIPAAIRHDDPDGSVRAFVAALARDGLLPSAPPAPEERRNCRLLCLARETLAYHDALADFTFAMENLGSAPLFVADAGKLCTRYFPRLGRGEAVTAFAISESEAGSDVAAIAATARREGEDWILDGEKTWISNGGIADWYIVLARTSDEGARGLTLFLVESNVPGFEVVERIATIAPHPLGRLRFTRCRLSDEQRVGNVGDGFKIAMRVLDMFRPSVAAAALGMARRAFDEAVAHVKARHIFGATLADLQMTQAALAEMATDIDAAALLTYRAAWQLDARDEGSSRESAMAKWNATEMAQRVIDRALQLFGARGLVAGHIVERLYRDVRSLRIYEGASEIQQLIIARQILKGGRRGA